MYLAEKQKMCEGKGILAHLWMTSPLYDLSFLGSQPWRPLT